MGPVDPSIRFEKSGATVLMLCGLQGSGKTTTCGKLAKLLAAQGRKPMLVAADLQRPAAIEQLRVIGGQLNVPVFSQEQSTPIKVCQEALAEANRQGCDTLILDTAGRLHVDDELMNELVQIEKKVKPHQVFFVCDAMTGQDAVASAEAFNAALELDGVILTKLDGDARGGAALSVRKVTGVPVKFVGKGEKLDRLEAFEPERLVGQMLGMGDIVDLVRTAQQVVDEEEAKRQQERLAKGKFDLNDFRQQIIQMKKMGSVGELHEQDPRAQRDVFRPRRHRRRQRDQAHPGHHRQHDPAGAQPSGPDRHVAEAADRRGRGGRSIGRLRAGQAVRRHGRLRPLDVADEHAGKAACAHGPGTGGRQQPWRPAVRAEGWHGQAAVAQGT